MSGNLGYPSHPVFMVDSSGNPKPQQYYHQHAQMMRGCMEPPLVPCWTFPPARSKLKKKSCGTLSAWTAWVLALLLLLVFSALGIGAYQIRHLQTQVEQLILERHTKTENTLPQKQVGLNLAELNGNKKTPAAHLIGSADQKKSFGPLKWETKVTSVFMEGVKYTNGTLQVSEPGLYFVYSRVEFRSNTCKPNDNLVHMMILRRDGSNQKILEDHREGFCTAEKDHVWMTGSHLGSLQHLKVSDLLFVNVSNPLLLSLHFNSNYFGLFKIH